MEAATSRDGADFTVKYDETMTRNPAIICRSLKPLEVVKLHFPL